jgi:hypothetical protein
MKYEKNRRTRLVFPPRSGGKPEPRQAARYPERRTPLVFPPWNGGKHILEFVLDADDGKDAPLVVGFLTILDGAPVIAGDIFAIVDIPDIQIADHIR